MIFKSCLMGGSPFRSCTWYLCVCDRCEERKWGLQRTAEDGREGLRITQGTLRPRTLVFRTFVKFVIQKCLQCLLETYQKKVNIHGGFTPSQCKKHSGKKKKKKHSVILMYLPNTGEWPIVFCVFVSTLWLRSYCCYIFIDEKSGLDD